MKHLLEDMCPLCGGEAEWAGFFWTRAVRCKACGLCVAGRRGRTSAALAWKRLSRMAAATAAPPEGAPADFAARMVKLGEMRASALEWLVTTTGNPYYNGLHDGLNRAEDVLLGRENE